MDHNKLWKILKDMGILDRLTCLQRNLYVGQESQLEPDMEQYTGSKLGKGYDKTVCVILLIYVQSTSCKMLGWVIHNLKSRLPREISATSDLQMIPLLWQKLKRN